MHASVIVSLPGNVIKMGWFCRICASVVLLIILLHCQVECRTTSCSSKRSTDYVLCLKEIKRRALNQSEFWMGTDYVKRCPNGSDSVSCFNPNAGAVHSLISTIFRSNNPRILSRLDRLIELNYRRQPGSYQSCRNTYRALESKIFSIDPTGDAINRPFDVRVQPDVRWRTRKGEGLFALIMVDGPLGSVNHWTVLNIRGNDINNADILFPYSGPKNPFTLINPYTVLLFQQKRRVNITTELRKEFSTLVNGMQTIDVPSLIKRFDLRGPLAINWSKIKHDPFSIEAIRRFPALNNCPFLVTKALRKIQRPFIPSDVDLTVSVDVRYRSPPIKFTSCCNIVSLPATTVELNPIGNAEVNTAVGRSEVVPMVALQKKAFFPDSNNFEDTLYTLLFVSPDASVPAAGTKNRPILRWMVTNIKNGKVTNGDGIIDYFNFASLGGPQFHFFLLYEQPRNISDEKKFLTEKCTGRPGGCRFDIARFTKENGLKLVGANWLVANEDAYSKFFLITVPGLNPKERCAGVTGFGMPCPNGLPVAALLNG